MPAMEIHSMTRSRMHAGAVAAAAVGLALVLGACGSNRPAAGPASTQARTTTPATTAQAGVNPNGPETNPAGDIPDNQVFVDYTPPAGGFTVKVPEGWARSSRSGAVTFADKLNSVTMRAVAA